MKKYLICLFILTVLLGLSCATAPTTPAPTQTVTQQPVSTPPAPAPAPVPQQQVTPPPTPVVPLSPVGLDMAGSVEYTVVFGDFLSEITRTFYGHLTDVGQAGTRNGFYYPLLMLASEGLIKDPDFILEGMKLNIPDLKNNLANAESRRAIKQILIDTAILYGNKRLSDEAEGLRRLADSL